MAALNQGTSADADLPRARRVAAIIVAWNSHELLPRCLQAVLDQTTPFSRVVVIDNHSPHELGEPEWCGEAAFRFLRMTSNLGFAAGNNQALRYCEDCEWIALINPDAFLATDWLANMLSAVERHIDVASLASTLVLDDCPDTLDGAGDACHVSGLVWRSAHGAARAGMRLVEQEVFSACAAAALYKRSALLEVGGFDERFFCYVEDVDLGFRLRLAGYSCWLIPTAVANHVGSASSGGQHSEFAVYHGHRNMVWCFFKNMPMSFLLAFLPLHVLMNVAAVLLFAGRGMARIVLRAKLDALTGLPAVWRSRREISVFRRASLRDVWRVLDKHIVPKP